jgi:hypothetical protein
VDVNLRYAGETNAQFAALRHDVTFLMYAIRWLTDTLPHDQQTNIYRQRQSEMMQMIDQLRAGGFAG